jgi:hypothetical protein
MKNPAKKKEVINFCYSYPYVYPILQNVVSPCLMVPLNVTEPLCVSTFIGIIALSTHDTSNGCCKVSPGVLGGVTVILKLPELMIVKVTVVNPVKDSGTTLRMHEGGRCIGHSLLLGIIWYRKSLDWGQAEF